MTYLYRSAVALFAVATGLLAQAPTPKAVPDEPSCPRCTISMQKVVTLGTDDGLGSLIGKPMSVNIDSRGRYWMFQELEPPTVFHADGRVDRVIGRKGSGPGEFSSGNRGIVVGDSMLVLDWMESRATMMSPDLKPGRIIRIPQSVGDIALLRWPTLLISAGMMPYTTPPHSMLHRWSMVGPEMKLLSSFGPTAAVDPMNAGAYFQHIGRAGDGIWSAFWSRPHFTKWKADGTPSTILTRRYAWYTGETKAEIGAPTRPPTPSTGPLIEDEAGLLWVFIYKPLASWKEAWTTRGTRVGGGHEYRGRDMNYDKLYDTYVEVIDPATARVVARHDIDGYVFEALPGRRIALFRLDQNGFPRVDIATVTLAGR